MGQFYKAEKIDHVANPIYQPPIELMAKVLESKDKIVDEGIAETENLNLGLEKLGAIADDMPHAQELVQQYKQRIKDIATTIQNNPLEYTRHTGDLKALSSQIQDEITNGALGVYHNQKLKLDKWREEQYKRAEKKENNINIADIDRFYAAAIQKLRKAGGTNYKGKNQYNDIGNYLENIVGSEDAYTIADKYAAKFKASLIEEAGSNIDANGNIIDVETSSKINDPRTIMEGTLLALKSDSNLMDYYDQRIRMGLMTEEEKETELALAAVGASTKYGFSETKNKSKYSGMTPQAKAALDFNYREMGQNNDLQRQMQLAIFKNDLKGDGEEDGGDGGSGKTSSKGGSGIVGRQGFNVMSGGQKERARAEYENFTRALANTYGIKANEKGQYTLTEISRGLQAAMALAQQAGDKRAIKDVREKYEKYKFMLNNISKTPTYSWDYGKQVGYKQNEIDKIKQGITSLKAHQNKFENTKMSFTVNGKPVGTMTYKEFLERNNLQEADYKIFLENVQPQFLGRGSSNILLNFAASFNGDDITATTSARALNIQTN